MKTDISTFESMSLEALEIAAQSAFEECENILQAIEKNRNRLEIFGKILTAAKAKVPHGEWENWITDTFQGRVTLRTVQRWMAGPKAQKVALLGESKNDTNVAFGDTRKDRITDRVEVVEPDPDPAPDPPTIRKTAAGSQKPPEASKPSTRPIVPEVLPGDEMEIAKVDPVAEWFDNHSLAEVVGMIVDKIEDDRAKKTAAKQLRKLADQLDPPTKFIPPTVEDVEEFCLSRNNSIDAEAFVATGKANGWLLSNGNKMKDWKAAIITWEKNDKKYSRSRNNGNGNGRSHDDGSVAAQAARLKEIFG